jgi:hypothetical protein
MIIITVTATRMAQRLITRSNGHLDDGNTAGQLGDALGHLLLVVGAVGLGELLLDLGNAGLDVLLQPEPSRDQFAFQPVPSIRHNGTVIASCSTYLFH